MLREKPPDHPGDICLPLLSSPTQSLTHCRARFDDPKNQGGWHRPQTTAGQLGTDPASLCPCVQQHLPVPLLVLASCGVETAFGIALFVIMVPAPGELL